MGSEKASHSIRIACAADGLLLVQPLSLSLLHRNARDGRQAGGLFDSDRWGRATLASCCWWHCWRLDQASCSWQLHWWLQGTYPLSFLFTERHVRSTRSSRAKCCSWLNVMLPAEISEMRKRLLTFSLANQDRTSKRFWTVFSCLFTECIVYQ